MENHDKFYGILLTQLFTKLEEGFEIANKVNGTKAAYMFLAIRDVNDPKGNIDIISNVTTPAIKIILEAALETVNKELQTKGKAK